MIRDIGIVKEVFIPYEYKDNSIESKKIGFKIKLDSDEITIIEEQNENNSKILKNDKVIIIKQVVSGIEFTDIELFDGDENE